MERTPFITYFCEFFDDDSEMFWFKKFKKIVRAHFKLMDTGDMDYEPVRRICRPATRHLCDVAKIFYLHNETYFREQVMVWMELAQEGDVQSSHLINAPHREHDFHFLRDSFYITKKSS